MGGNSTSSALNSAVLTDKKTESSGAFDLQSWQGLTALLKTGKDALKDPSEYASFRNLVLQYAQHGGDVELKQKIITIVRSFADVPTHETPHTTSLSPHGDAVSVQKAEPSFLPHAVTSQETTETVSVQRSVPTRRLVPRFIENTKSDVRTVEIDSKNTELVPPTPTPEPAIQPFSQPESKIEVTIPKPTPSIPSTPEPTQPEVLSVTPSGDNHKTRIAEIKNSVHSLFGNPAALMNLHNGVGQIYMKALLLAMKATSPGSDENEDKRMAELETAYKALIDESESTVEPSIVEEPKVEEIAENVAIDEPLIPTETTLPLEEEVTVPLSPVREEIIPETASEESSPAPEEDAPEQRSEIKYSAKHTLEQLSSRTSQLKMNEYVPEDEKPHLPRADSTISHNIVTPQTSRVGGASSELHNTNPAYTSVVNRPTVSGIDTKQSELVSEEISVALKKLLHDWNIFEGSGLFGIGPGGIDHPLYEKLAPLSMGEVIAGRWEKSDPKITKTIKEYVDAWRHEQGIAYTINETFEHYLRRVIQRILKRQSAQ